MKLTHGGEEVGKKIMGPVRISWERYNLSGKGLI
jgi:hypothetical protein